MVSDGARRKAVFCGALYPMTTSTPLWSLAPGPVRLVIGPALWAARA